MQKVSDSEVHNCFKETTDTGLHIVLVNVAMTLEKCRV